MSVKCPSSGRIISPQAAENVEMTHSVACAESLRILKGFSISKLIAEDSSLISSDYSLISVDFSSYSMFSFYFLLVLEYFILLASYTYSILAVEVPKD